MCHPRPLGLPEAGAAAVARGGGWAGEWGGGEEAGPPKPAAESPGGERPGLAGLLLASTQLLRQAAHLSESARGVHAVPVKGQIGNTVGATWSLSEPLSSPLVAQKQPQQYGGT